MRPTSSEDEFKDSKDIVAWLLRQGWICVFVVSEKKESVVCWSHFPLLAEKHLPMLCGVEIHGCLYDSPN